MCSRIKFCCTISSCNYIGLSSVLRVSCKLVGQVLRRNVKLLRAISRICRVGRSGVNSLGFCKVGRVGRLSLKCVGIVFCQGEGSVRLVSRLGSKRVGVVPGVGVSRGRSVLSVGQKLSGAVDNPLVIRLSLVSRVSVKRLSRVYLERVKLCQGVGLLSINLCSSGDRCRV